MIYFIANLLIFKNLSEMINKFIKKNLNMVCNKILLILTNESCGDS